MTDIFEGSIIRSFRRLQELLRQMGGAARAIGNSDLETKFEDSIKLLERPNTVVFNPSYVEIFCVMSSGSHTDSTFCRVTACICSCQAQDSPSASSLCQQDIGLFALHCITTSHAADTLSSNVSTRSHPSSTSPILPRPQKGEYGVSSALAVGFRVASSREPARELKSIVQKCAAACICRNSCHNTSYI